MGNAITTGYVVLTPEEKQRLDDGDTTVIEKFQIQPGQCLYTKYCTDNNYYYELEAHAPLRALGDKNYYSPCYTSHRVSIKRRLSKDLFLKMVLDPFNRYGKLLDGPYDIDLPEYRITCKLINSKLNGVFTMYHRYENENGMPFSYIGMGVIPGERCFVGKYNNGKPIGVWTRYNFDDTIEQIKN